MEPIEYESRITDKGAPANDGAPEKAVSPKPKAISASQGDTGRSSQRWECRSITLCGAGDQSGRDIDNAMSLEKFYGRMLVADYERRSQDESEVPPVNPLLAGIPVVSKPREQQERLV